MDLQHHPYQDTGPIAGCNHLVLPLGPIDIKPYIPDGDDAIRPARWSLLTPMTTRRTPPHSHTVPRGVVRPLVCAQEGVL